MKKHNRSKLYLKHETIRALTGAQLRPIHGGDGIPVSKPQVCGTTAHPECATNENGVCRSLGGGCGSIGQLTDGCPPSETC